MELAPEPLPYHQDPGYVLPRQVWRVTHPRTKSIGDETIGMRSQAQGRLSGEELLYAITQHIEWKSREPSHFTSAFTKKSHAIYWARRIQRNGRYPLDKVLNCKIDMTRLSPGSTWFDAEITTKKLGIKSTYAEDENFILSGIPAACISPPESLAVVRCVPFSTFPVIHRKIVFYDSDEDLDGSGEDQDRDEDEARDEDGEDNDDELGYGLGYAESANDSDSSTDEIISA